MAKAPKIIPAKEVELNRWCIEMAMRWPIVSVGGYGNAVGGFQQSMPRMDSDADVIGRANKIKTWVKTSQAA